MPLAWVAALPSRRDSPCPRARLVRLLIPSLAVLQALLAYPVAGTQVLLGSVLPVLCGAVCLADGWSELVAWNTLHRSGNPIAAPALAALFAALAIGGVFENIVQPLQVNHDQYRANTSVTIAGATRLRLSAAQGSAIDQVVALVRGRCRTLISLPGLYSLNIGTGLPTPSPLTGVQPFWLTLSFGQQSNVLAVAQASRGLYAVRDDSLAASYGGAPSSSPLVLYIERDFVPIAQFPPYSVEVHRS